MTRVRVKPRRSIAGSASRCNAELGHPQVVRLLQWVNRYTSDFDGMSASTSSGRAPKGEIDVMGQQRMHRKTSSTPSVA
jgi:hypothetical protein